MKKILAVIAVLLLLVGGYVWSTYNSLVAGNERVTSQWAQVQAQYQRRFDLIPNLVSSVQATLTQEQDVFKSLADARTRYSGAAGADEKAQAATQVESALSRLLVIVESYPTLRSSEVVQTFMSQLEGTENRIAVERGRFNDQAASYNAGLRRFPTNLVASSFGFSPRAYFEAPAEAQSAPKANFTK